jgi:hypothetical protein
MAHRSVKPLTARRAKPAGSSRAVPQPSCRIESLRCPTLAVEMRAARRLGLTVPPEVLRRAGRIIQ